MTEKQLGGHWSTGIVLFKTRSQYTNNKMTAGGVDASWSLRVPENVVESSHIHISDEHNAAVEVWAALH